MAAGLDVPRRELYLAAPAHDDQGEQHNPSTIRLF